MGSFQNVPTGYFGWVLFKCNHNVTGGHKSNQSDGYFSKVITKYPLGKWGFAPSGCSQGTKLTRMGSTSTASRKGLETSFLHSVMGPKTVLQGAGGVYGPASKRGYQR